jgi:hypothetical protein
VRRREFIGLLGGVAVARPVGACAQQSTMRSNSSGISANPLLAGIFTELRQLDSVDGRNAIYEPRFSFGDPERLPSLASDLVDRKVHIIVATGGILLRLLRTDCGTWRTTSAMQHHRSDLWG